MKPASAAFLYDFLQVQGGAEAVTLSLCERFPELRLVTAFVNPVTFSEAPLSAERLTTLTSATTIQGWQAIKTSHAFRSKTEFLGDLETLIFSGFYAPLALQAVDPKTSVYYCHTPPRFVYDLKHYYLDAVSSWQRALLNALIWWYQPQYEAAMRKMDVVYANSINTQQRLRRFLGIDAEVLYPPCNLEGYQFLSQGDYYLSTARLEPYKRVDTVVQAFMRMPSKRLVVTSGGSQLAHLKKLAAGASNIEFTGWVTQQELQRLVGNALATVYIPKDEDFGISPVQSMAAGKPVIGVNEGGVAETVLHESTGCLLNSDPSPADLVRCIETLTPDLLLNLRYACQNRAKLFGGNQFYDQMGMHIGSVC